MIGDVVGLGKTITATALAKIFEDDFGLETLIICPKNLTANMILRHVRAAKNTRGSNMQNLYNVVEGEVEAAEFIVQEGSSVVGTPLSGLKLKKDVLVASIVRNDKVILPRGNDCILAGDSVILVTKDVSLLDIEDALA